jgi:aminoglycoside 3-N-acetyltransferase
MLGFVEFKRAFDELGLAGKPVIVHAALKQFGAIQGGPRTLVQALAASFSSVMVPTFTYKTMITPEVGPPNNGITYGSHKDQNKMAEQFYPLMPPDKMMGKLPDALVYEKDAIRTLHPILSFAGIRADEYLRAQTLFNPLAPIAALMEDNGWVLLLNVRHDVNTSIHYGEKLIGRRQFVRWALMSDRIVECPGYPGDSDGFHKIEEYIKDHTLRVEMKDGAFIQALPLKRLVEVTVELIKKDPLALLCDRDDCERCNAVRNTQG